MVMVGRLRRGDGDRKGQTHPAPEAFSALNRAAPSGLKPPVVRHHLLQCTIVTVNSPCRCWLAGTAGAIISVRSADKHICMDVQTYVHTTISISYVRTLYV